MYEYYRITILLPKSSKNQIGHGYLYYSFDGKIILTEKRQVSLFFNPEEEEEKVPHIKKWVQDNKARIISIEHENKNYLIKIRARE